MQYYIIYVGHLYEMCCFPPFKRTTLQFNSKLSIATRFNASILIAITFIHYPLSFSYIKLQAVCIQLKIHQSLSNLIKIQVGILDKNGMFQFFFGLLLNNISISAALSQDGSWTAEAETVETAVIDFPHESSFVDIWTSCALVQTI